MEPTLYGFLSTAPSWVAPGLVLLALIMGYNGAPLLVWLIGLHIVLLGYAAPESVLFFSLGVSIVLGLPFIRRYVISFGLLSFLKAMKFLPTISQTERTAIEAGNVWMDAELFSGKPNYKKILTQNYPKLSEEEQAFVDGPCEELCRMVDDWDVHRKRDFPQHVWDYMKQQKFFGIIIPKKYGGLEFSAIANSAIVAKLSSRSTPLGITVMVPNSLGPAELLTHYGTKEQCDYYLPRLAIGEEVPCFALTEPTAGSDAGAMTSYGEVFEGKDGKPWMRLHWNKRYITLAAISTVLGLAFKLEDPENLLGRGTDLGITCALIPTSTKGVVIGRRHDPLGVPFYNCPTEGHDVEVPVSSIIGGVDGSGQGWRMLMESLAAGRGISLPATATGGTKFVARVASAYSAVRKQFGVPIGKFEGIEEKLGKIAGYSYLMEAARSYTCGGIDQGEKPSVVTAIMKYHTTEYFREAVNDGMDIVGGAGISLGKANLLAHPYFAAPISITVEGANILTRTLIIFGQGAIRCHPHILKEIEAIESGNLKAFDIHFFKHVGHVIRNLIRAVLLSVTRGHLAVFVPGGLETRRFYQKLSWVSAKFAFYADVALGTMGGALKRKEMLTGRYGDILSMMYLGISVLSKYEHDGRLKQDLPFVKWSMRFIFSEIQKAFQLVFDNLGPAYLISSLWSQINPVGRFPEDTLTSKLARLIQTPGAQRDALTDGIFIPKDESQALAKLEDAFEAYTQALAPSKKITKAIRKKVLPKAKVHLLIDEAVAKSVISQAEADIMKNAERLRLEVIQVDDYSQEDYLTRS